MKHHVDIVDGLTSVADALRQMKHVETKCLLVRKRHEDDEFGIVLISDIAKQVLAKNRAPERVHIYEIMSKPVLSAAPDMNIRYCARMFDHFDLSRAPVVENGEIIGIVSHTDMVLKGLCREI
jgi:predicted transcriptional regulator